jgi:hypothetical protein
MVGVLILLAIAVMRPELDEGTFTEGHELDGKRENQVPKAMIGRDCRRRKRRGCWLSSTVPSPDGSGSNAAVQCWRHDDQKSSRSVPLRDSAYPGNFNRHENNRNGRNKRHCGGYCTD